MSIPLVGGLIDSGSAAVSYLTKSGLSGAQQFLNAISYGVNKVSHLAVNASGYAIDNAPEILSYIIFSKVIYEGGKMAADPLKKKDDKNQWYRFAERFRKKPELKVKPLNVSDLIKKESLPEILAKNQQEAAKAAQEKADDASKKLIEAHNSLNAATSTYNTTHANDDLRKKIEAEKIYRACNETFKKLQTEADAAKNIADIASEPLKKKKDDKKDKADEPENFMMNFSVEMSKPKEGESEWKIPLSDEALFINHENLKKTFTRSAAGIAMISMGLLGNIDTIGHSDKLHWTWGIPARIIGLPVHFASDIVGNVVGKAVQNGPWGFSKLAVAGGLAYASYRLNWSTKLVWFNFGENRPAPGIDKDTIKKDVAKIALMIITATASLYALNDFVHGNS